MMIPRTVLTIAALAWTSTAFADPKQPRIEQAEGSSAEPPASSTSTPKRHAEARIPPPSPEAARASLARIKEIFAADYAAPGPPAKKTKLAQQLAEQVDHTQDVADRWALLTEALRIATDGGDVATALSLIERIPREFAVERDASRLEALSRLSHKTSGPAVESVGAALLRLAAELETNGDADVAGKALSLASAIARKTKNSSMLAESTQRLQALKDQQKLLKDLEPLLDKVKSDPADPKANLDAGVALCLKAHRWTEGLPLLKKGSDQKLALLAEAELKPTKSAIDSMQLADGWWDWAASQKSALRDGAIRHAANLYQTALPDLSGLAKVKAEKRLHEATLGTEGSEQTTYLADIKELRVIGAKYGFSKDGTYMGKPFTCLNEKWPKAITAISDGSAAATVEYQLPSSASRIQGRVGVFSPSDAKPDQQPGAPLVFEVVADGRVVWRSPPMTKRDTAQPFRADLRGATHIELRTQTDSGYCAWGAWLDPQVIR